MGPLERWRDTRSRSHQEVCERGYDPSKTRSSNLSAMRHSTRACSSSPSSASCRPTIRASRAPSRQSNARSFATDLSCATTPAPAWTACRPAKALSSPAASGLSTTMCCWGGTTRRPPCSSACWRCATTWGLLAEQYDPHGRRQLGNFPQAFSHLALINSAHSLNTTKGAAHLRSGGGGSAPVQPGPRAGADKTSSGRIGRSPGRAQ